MLKNCTDVSDGAVYAEPPMLRAAGNAGKHRSLDLYIVKGRSSGSGFFVLKAQNLLRVRRGYGIMILKTATGKMKK